MNTKEIKKEIRQIRKIKLQCKAGSKERVELHRKMTALKAQLQEIKKVDVDKEPLIEKIMKLKPHYKTIGLYLNKFSIKQLEFHLNKIEHDK